VSCEVASPSTLQSAGMIGHLCIVSLRSGSKVVLMA